MVLMIKLAVSVSVRPIYNLSLMMFEILFCYNLHITHKLVNRHNHISYLVVVGYLLLINKYMNFIKWFSSLIKTIIP